MSADAPIIEQVEGCAAAVGCQVQVLTDPQEVSRLWTVVDVALVGVDAAELVATLELPGGPRVRLVGGDQAELLRWSAVLAYPAVVLPEQATAVTAVLATSQVAGPGGSLLRLVGASGGLGVSTAAAALAVTAAASGRRVAAVELAPTGGGLDLLFGAESVSGWRWPELVSARGHLPDLGGRLPQACGVDLVSAGRDWVPINAAAAHAVVSSLTRSHDLVVVDAGRGESAAGVALATASTWLLVGAEVRSVMAARALLSGAGLDGAQLVIRSGVGRHLDTAEIGQALSKEVLGRLNDDRWVPVGAELGEPPGWGRRGQWRRRGLARDCRLLLSRLPGGNSNSAARPSRSVQPSVRVRSVGAVQPGVPVRPETSGQPGQLAHFPWPNPASDPEIDRPTAITRVRPVTPRRLVDRSA